LQVRTRPPRVILGAAEAEIAGKFAEIAQIYAADPVALPRRGVNMLHDSVKERASTIIVPGSAVDRMNLGGLAGPVAVACATIRRRPTAPRQARACSRSSAATS
jgi:hypothetical protein